MNPLRYIAVLTLFACTLAVAETNVFKSLKGVVVVANYGDFHFLVDVPGKEIQPVGEKEAPYPRFTVDGCFLQIVPSGVTNLKLPQKASAKEILVAQYHYEIDYYEIPSDKAPKKILKLADGTPFVYWSMTPKETTHKHHLLSFQSKGHILMLSLAEMDGKTQINPLEYLQSIANSFYKSPKPIKLTWDDEGNYHYGK